MNKFKFKEVNTKHFNSSDQWTQGFIAGAGLSIAIAVALT